MGIGTKDVETAVRLAPGQSRFHLNLGLVRMGQWREVEALDSFGRAIGLEPLDADAWYNRGVAHAALGQHREAAEDFENTVARNSIHVEAWFNLGLAREYLGEPGKARANYEEAVRLNPSLGQAWYRMGEISYTAGALDIALAELDRAAALLPDLAEVQHLRYVVLAGLERGPEARAAITEAIRLAPERVDYVLERAKLHEMQGNVRAAAKDLEAAIHLVERQALDSDQAAIVDTMRRTLESLRSRIPREE